MTITFRSALWTLKLALDIARLAWSTKLKALNLCDLELRGTDVAILFVDRFATLQPTLRSDLLHITQALSGLTIRFTLELDHSQLHRACASRRD